MYLEHFQLKIAPFRCAPDHRFYFASGEHRRVLEQLCSWLSANNGVVRLTGEPGVGKSMLLRELAVKAPEHTRTLVIKRVELSAENLLNLILLELKLAEQPLSLMEAINVLHGWLAQEQDEPRRLLIIIDEAERLLLDALNELSMIAQFELPAPNRFAVVISGNQDFQDRLERARGTECSPEINQCIPLGPMAREDVGAYLNHRVRQAGYPGDELFYQPLAKAIAGQSGGLPMRINQLADSALSAAAQVGATVPEPDHLERQGSAEEKVMDDEAARGLHIEWLIAGGILLLGVVLYLGSLPWPQNDAAAITEPEPLAPPRAKQTAEPVSQAAVARKIEAPVAAEAAETLLGDALIDSLSEDVGGLIAGEEDLPAVEREVVVTEPEVVVATPVQLEVEQASLMPGDSRLYAAQERLQQWLQQAGRSAGTIQLLLVRGGADSQVETYLAELEQALDAEELMVYASDMQGRPVYGVVYRRFASRQEALAAANDMPAAVSRLGPFIARSAGGIADELH